ncbi:uncharacterized protein LOC135182767 isoform X2 [Pogoniulus pusillus]|uniref:uncharacterized protein LOC135182767 isoform X2 n=1 Tax=Pogoniulus pusillus TaxID=488313 RepID=UPI0030B983CD
MSGHSVSQHETVTFVLHKSIPDHEEVFENVPEGEIQPGDILLFPTEDSGSLFKHAAVYLGDTEVIHFQGVAGEENTGQISKEGFQAMKKVRGKCQVYRKRGGIKVNEFRMKVREVMNSTGSYYPGSNNCIHFALWLLDLTDFCEQLVEIRKEDSKDEAGSIPTASTSWWKSQISMEKIRQRLSPLSSLPGRALGSLQGHSWAWKPPTENWRKSQMKETEGGHQALHDVKDLARATSA